MNKTKTHNKVLTPEKIQKYKEYISLIYDLTQTESNVNFRSANDKKYKETATELVKRGVLTKRLAPKEMRTSNKGRQFVYQWNPKAMAPTAVFINNIAVSVEKTLRDRGIKFRESRKELLTKASSIVNDPPREYLPKTEEQAAEIAAVSITQQEPDTQFVSTATLALYSDKELYDELKSRGYFIEDNRLVKIKKAYLD